MTTSIGHRASANTQLGPDRARIETTLGVLIGQPFWSIGRAADLTWLSFGRRRRVVAPLLRGSKVIRGSKIVGEFAIHLQCPWRLVVRREILVASGDIYAPPDDSGARRRGWRWDKGPNRFDRRIREALPETDAPLAVVRGVKADRFGGFRLRMSRQLTLEVFPANTEIDEYAEYWRFCRPSRRGRHFVVSHARSSWS
jgi:hypothetical protein